MNKVLEELENGYKIYQDKDSFNFGVDTVLLSNFVISEYGLIPDNKMINKNGLNICDLCTGSLPIPLLLYARRKEHLIENINILAFEIDKEQVDICNDSILYNLENVNDINSDGKNIKDNIIVINDDLKNIYLDKEKKFTYFGGKEKAYKNLYETFDIVTCNPPYIKKGSGIVNVNDKKKLARHEYSVEFDDICKVASLILKSNKKFYFIHHTERLTELLIILKKYNLEPKKLKFIYTNTEKPSSLVLVEVIKNGKTGISILAPENLL